MEIGIDSFASTGELENPLDAKGNINRYAISRSLNEIESCNMLKRATLRWIQTFPVNPQNRLTLGKCDYPDAVKVITIPFQVLCYSKRPHNIGDLGMVPDNDNRSCFL